MHPQKFREIVLQMLFALDMGADDSVIPFVMQKAAVSRKVGKEGFARAKHVWDAKKLLDQKIANTSQSYELERIPIIEKNILRYALYEMAEGVLAPPIVIQEAIRLARKFSTPEAGTFINALLHTLSSLSPQPGEASC